MWWNNKAEETEVNEWLDGIELIFCIKYGLPLCKKDYTKYELELIRQKAIKEEAVRDINQKKKLYKILSQ